MHYLQVVDLCFLLVSLKIKKAVSLGNPMTLNTETNSGGAVSGRRP